MTGPSLFASYRDAIVVTVLISAPSAWLARYWRGDFS